MPTVAELAIKVTREASANLARYAKATPEEKITWQPLDNGRPILEQLLECGGLNFMTASLLKDKVFPTIDAEARQKLIADNDTLEKALEFLEQSTNTLVAAIEAFPAEELDASATLPFGRGLTKTFAEWMLFPYWNMNYHLGQVCYIQTLYGDKDMH